VHDPTPCDPTPWIALRETPGLRLSHARELLARFGSPLAVFAQSASRLAALCPQPVAASLSRGPALEPAAAELERARRLGLQVLLQGQPGFPDRLVEMRDPPLVLYLRGALPAEPRVSIVGARRGTVRGRETARAFAAEIAAAGIAVVSGLAYGVDSAAHAGALDGAGPTLAVLASGLDHATPRGNQRLAARILDAGGGWLSEYPPGTGARAHHFPHRNRLISALSSTTLVIEARAGSGSLWTATHALEQGRDLFAVPGPIDTDLCLGSNRLLRDGAHVALEAEDVVRWVLRHEPRSVRPAGVAPAVTDVEARVLERLREGPCDPDELGRSVRLAASELAALLLDLELRGLIARHGSRLALQASARGR
jgi:DNA processing protein